MVDLVSRVCVYLCVFLHIDASTLEEYHFKAVKVSPNASNVAGNPFRLRSCCSKM